MKRMQFGVMTALVAASIWSSTAQSPTATREIKSAEIARFAWPRLARLQPTSRFYDSAALQLLLRNQGFYSGATNGVYDFNGSFDAQAARSIEREVRAFQRAKRLRASGVIDEATWAKLLVKLRRGDRGDAVRALQKMLDSRRGEHSPRAKIDGIFGTQTELEVRELQRANRIQVNGIVGAQTWCLLVGGKYLN